MAEIGAGTEGGRGAGDDDGAHVRVGLEPIEGLADLVAQGEVERVAAFGVVEGDGGHPIGRRQAVSTQPAA